MPGDAVGRSLPRGTLASKGQGIEDQTLPALSVSAVTWELGPGAPKQLGLVWDKAQRWH